MACPIVQCQRVPRSEEYIIEVSVQSTGFFLYVENIKQLVLAVTSVGGRAKPCGARRLTDVEMGRNIGAAVAGVGR